MNECNIKMEFPKKVLKGSGIKNTAYLPYYIYNLKIIIENNTEYFKICSLNSTFANGFSYIDNLHISGDDKDIIDYIKIVEPNKVTGNNNLILFANNFKLSPLSKNTISLNLAITNNYTENNMENTGIKIKHKTNLNLNAYLLCDNNVYSDNITTQAMDCMVDISAEDNVVNVGNTTKYYINIKAGQYDLIRKPYLKFSLNNGLNYINESSNIEPNQIYFSNNRTILKWNFDCINPMECKKIGFKVKVKEKYSNDTHININDSLISSVNTNGVNNSSYKQCFDSKKYTLIVN